MTTSQTLEQYLNYTLLEQYNTTKPKLEIIQYLNSVQGQNELDTDDIFVIRALLDKISSENIEFVYDTNLDDYTGGTKLLLKPFLCIDNILLRSSINTPICKYFNIVNKLFELPEPIVYLPIPKYLSLQDHHTFSLAHITSRYEFKSLAVPLLKELVDTIREICPEALA